MTKTIEEAANEYADNAYYPAPDYGWYESDDEQMKECLSETFKAGANYVYGLPLASRLTTKEKERVRKIYTECELIEMDDSPNLPADRITEATAKIQVLESIFGTDFFKEGG